ncbi:MAG: DUF3659 domain-containing protein [Actinomycetota bacterium]
MRTRTMALVLGLALLAACGQKPGISRDFTEGMLPAGATVNEQGQIVDAEGNVIGEVPEGSDVSSFGQVTGAGPAPAEVAGGDAGGGTAPGAAPGEAPPVGANSTGVTDDMITIGAHAPLTGAAPVPSDSAHKGNALLWEWLERNERRIHGRRVTTTLKNDNYNPSQAVAVCKEMVEKDRVFLLYGFAGTDQIQACARYAASVAVPYVSVGVTEVGLTNLPNYFALSLSYPEQGPMLVDYLVTKLAAKGERNGMLRFDTPNFEDAHAAFVDAARERGIELVYDRAVSKNATQAEANTVVQEMKAHDLDNVYVLTSPVWFLQVLQASKTQSFEPQWTGVGITKTLDTVASVGCRNGTLNKAKFFSPFPAWADMDRFDPEFGRAVDTIYPEENGGDDIMVIPWGMEKIMVGMFEAAGRDLTRESFVRASERIKNLDTEVYPTVAFSPTDHFGGSAVHVNEAHCSGYKTGDNRWHTIMSFVSDF